MVQPVQVKIADLVPVKVYFVPCGSSVPKISALPWRSLTSMVLPWATSKRHSVFLSIWCVFSVMVSCGGALGGVGGWGWGWGDGR